MAFFDSKQDIDVKSKCPECGHETEFKVELGINLEPATVNLVEVIG